MQGSPCPQLLTSFVSVRNGENPKGFPCILLEGWLPAERRAKQLLPLAGQGPGPPLAGHPAQPPRTEEGQWGTAGQRYLSGKEKGMAQRGGLELGIRLGVSKPELRGRSNIQPQPPPETLRG